MQNNFAELGTLKKDVYIHRCLTGAEAGLLPQSQTQSTFCMGWTRHAWACHTTAQAGRTELGPNYVLPNVLGPAHRFVLACPNGHAQAINWACHSWIMPKRRMGQAQLFMPMQLHGHAQAGKSSLVHPLTRRLGGVVWSARTWASTIKCTGMP